MKKKYLIFVLLFFVKVQAAPLGYKIFWEDNFDGNNLNAKNWNINTDYRDDAKQSIDSIIIKDGVLKLTTYTEGKIHHTGFLTTKGLFEDSYGFLPT